MNRDQRRAPRLEPLEGKLLLSTAQARAHVAPAAIGHIPTPAPPTFTLAGSLQMPVSSLATATDTSGRMIGTYQLRGRLGTMGNVTGTFVALLDSTGQTMVKGELRLTNRMGTVYLKMAVDPRTIAAYDWTVDYGTDAYLAAKGSGVMYTQGVASGGRVLLFNLTMS